ncbi:hypothetical protein BJX70DRAFT_390601 [Aspergillus crustosus]
MTDAKYEEIRNAEEDGRDDNSSTERLYREVTRRKRLQRLVIIQWVVLIAMTLLIIIGGALYMRDQDIRIPQLLYSPLQNLVEYEKVTFDGGFNHSYKSPYSGFPDEANNAAWEDLYNYGIISIPRSEAAKLHESTMPLDEDATSYMVEIDVFHQLHCLNHVRKLAWGLPLSDFGVNKDNQSEVDAHYIHVDHCINSVRQSLMCSSDISTIHWLWVDKDQMWEADGSTVHTCRNFETLRDWAFEHRAGMIDRSVYVEDPLRTNGHFP